MNTKEASEILLEGLRPNFEKCGFELNKKKREFARTQNGIIQIFDFFFYKKKDYISVKPEIRIKVNDIESIYKSISNIKDRPYCTLGNHLFEIVRFEEGGDEKGVRKEALADWLIQNDFQIKKLIEVIPTYLKEFVLPYFEEFSSVSKVDEVLNKYPRELSIHNYLYPLRANIAIIAAKLNKNPQYGKLIKIYEEELQEAEETYKEEFFRLKNKLEYSL